MAVVNLTGVGVDVVSVDLTGVGVDMTGVDVTGIEVFCVCVDVVSVEVFGVCIDVTGVGVNVTGIDLTGLGLDVFVVGVNVTGVDAESLVSSCFFFPLKRHRHQFAASRRSAEEEVSTPGVQGHCILSRHLTPVLQISWYQQRTSSSTFLVPAADLSELCLVLVLRSYGS